MDMQFNSLFVADLVIGPEAYITELLLLNKINYLCKIGKKISKPNCAFWRKDVVENHPTFKELQKDYVLEISYVKDLLKCFSPNVVIEYVKAGSGKGPLISFRLVPLDKQQITIYNLFKAQCKHLKDSKKLAKKADKKMELVTNVQKKSTQKTNLSILN